MESPGEDPDVWDLFRHYDKLYFRGALVDAAFTVEWTSPRTKTTSCFGSCSFGKMSKTITLYQPMLEDRTSADLKNALLHLMIHAIIFVKHGMNSLSSHGPLFRDWMDAINACSIEDYLRPKRGYCITTTHDFSQENLCSIQGNLWKCELCNLTLLRATKLGPPSDSCCIENDSQHATCGNMLCYWHNHKMNCGGTYVVPRRRGQKMVMKGKLGLLRTETSKSQEAVQESDSDEVQENSTVAKPNAEGKLLSQVYCRNARSPGSSSSKKASKSNMPEDYQKTIVLPVTPWKRLKPKQELVASEKQERLSTISCNNAKSLGSCSLKKADDFPLSKLKRKHTSVASEKHALISLGSYNNAKSSRSNTSSKADKWHKPEHVQKSSVQPFASRKKPKLEQDLDVSEKYGAFSLGSCNNPKAPRSSTSRHAGTWHKPKGVEKSSVPLATPLKKLKLEPGLVALEKHGDAKPLGSSTGNKVGKLHKPEGVEKSSVPLAAPLKTLKLEPGLVALEKHGDAKPLGSSTGNKPDCIQKASVLPAAAPRNLKQDLAASQKNELSSCGGRSNANVLDTISSKKAHTQREHEETRKPIAQPAAPQSIPKQQNKTNSSVKAGKQQHDPEDCRRIFSQPAVSQRKLKQSNPVAPKRPRTRSKTGGSPIHGQRSEAPVESAPSRPNLQVVTQDPRDQSKAPAPRVETVVVPPVDQVMAQTPRGQCQPPTQRMDIVIPPPDLVMTQGHRDPSSPFRRMDIAAVPPADQVMTEAPRGQSQPPAQRMDITIPPADLAMTRTHGDPSVPSTCMDIAAIPPADQVITQAPVNQSQPPAATAIATPQVVPPHSADPPSLPPSNPSSCSDIIDISDDE